MRQIYCTTNTGDFEFFSTSSTTTTTSFPLQLLKPLPHLLSENGQANFLFSGFQNVYPKHNPSAAGTKRAADESGPTTRSAKSAKTDETSTASKTKKGGNKKSPAKVCSSNRSNSPSLPLIVIQAVLPASQFKAKALPLHVNVTHTPPSAGDDDTVPSTSADPGQLGSLTLVPSSFNTGSYGWKGSKRLTVELENDTGTKEKVQVMLTYVVSNSYRLQACMILSDICIFRINATVLNSKNAPSEEEKDEAKDTNGEAAQEKGEEEDGGEKDGE